MSVPALRTVEEQSWRLFLNWCAATEVDPAETTLDTLTMFAKDNPAGRQVHRRRWRAVLRHLSELGLEAPTLPVSAPERAWREGAGWLGVGEALERLDPFGWPQAFIARRDGFLIVAVGALAMTRAQVTSLTGRDVRWPLAEEEGEWPSIAGAPIPYDPDPDQCPSCHVRHWLAVLDGWQEGGRFGAKRVCDQSRPERHACQFAPGPGWRAVPALAPSIDRHGWPGEALSRRSVTALLGRRQEAPFVFPERHDDPEVEDVSDEGVEIAPKPVRERPVGMSAWAGKRPVPDVEIDSALDRLDAMLAALEKDVAGVLADAEAPLPKPSVPR